MCHLADKQLLLEKDGDVLSISVFSEILHNKHNLLRCIILQNGLLLQTIIPCIIPLAIFFAM